MAVSSGPGKKTKLTVNRYPEIRRQLPNLARAIVTKATFDTLAQIVQKAPVDTGNLKNSYQTWLGPILPGVFAGQVFTLVEYAPHVEYGTRYMEAQPHVIPSFEQTARGVQAAAKAIMAGWR